MKKCPVCGRSNTDDSEVCESCGNQLGDGRNIFDAYKALNKDAVDILLDGRGKHSESGNKEVSSTSKRTSENLIDPDETVQATIGVSYIQNLISGEGFKNGAAILTDRRLYYFGRSFSKVGRGINTATEEGVVSVEDITYTHIDHGSPVSLLIAAVASFVLAALLFINTWGSTDDSAGMMGFLILVFLILGAVFLVAYYVGKSTVLEIEFPGGEGGKYCFDARWHSLSSMREFQRQIHLVKDRIKAGQSNGKNERTEAAQ